MSDSPVRVSHTGAVRAIALNRPAALNSVTTAMHAELPPALNAAAYGVAAGVGANCALCCGFVLAAGSAGFIRQADVQRAMGRRHDFGEGGAAFFAKPPPVFKDR